MKTNRARSLALFFALCGGVVWPSVAAAQATSIDADEALSVPSSTLSIPDDLAPDAQIVRQGRPLNLGDAVALAIQNNLDVEVARYAPAIAIAEREAAWGAYDPLLSADMGYDVRKSPNTFGLNAASSNRDREKGGGIGVDQLVPWLGARLGLRYEASSTSNRSTVQLRDPQYDVSLFATATLPLARGLVWNQEWTNVQVSALAGDAAIEAFRASVMDTVQATVDAYWALVAAGDQVRVAQKSLETARALLDQTQTQFEVGVVSRVEVVESEAGVANREFDVIRIANDYRNAQDTLIDAVLGREMSALTDLQFSPTEDPEAYAVRPVEVDRAVEIAFAERPEFKQAIREIEQGELNLKFAKNQRLPQFDVEGRFGYIGISGETNASINPAFLGGNPPPPNAPFDQADDDFFQRSGSDNYRVTGRFSIPIPNTAARNRAVQSDLELRRARTRKSRLEQTIILEVRRAARTLLASAQGIEAAERRRLAAEEQLRAERIRLEHGESTPFEVLQRESDLVEAESQKIDALRSYRSAEVGLERATGTILGFHDVVLDKTMEPAP